MLFGRLQRSLLQSQAHQTEMKLGILETGRITPEKMAKKYGTYHGMFVRLLENKGIDLNFVPYAVIDDIFPVSTDECDAWLITGSKHGAYEDLPWIRKLEDFIRSAAAENIPMIGICFGHQVIAKALGGIVNKSEKGWGLGVHDYDILKRPAWIDHHDDVKFSINAIHQDQVIKPPEHAEVIASSDFCPHAMLVYGETILTLQGHPEFEHDFYSDLIHARKGVTFDENHAEHALSRKDEPIYSMTVAKWIIRFLKTHQVETDILDS